MDPLTHALASYTLNRAAFPSATRAATYAMILAGTLADLDLLSHLAGPAAFLAFHRTILHSLVAAFLISILVTLPFFLRKSASFLALFLPALAAAILHLLLDLAQSSGVELLWPLSSSHFALDWLPPLDLWILAVFLAGILLPILAHLVTEEIGARSKTPRGKIGASLSLAAVLLYVVLRFVLHNNAVTALDSRSYRGESPRQSAAFAESASPFVWHGIVETVSALHELELNVGPGGSFDPEAAVTTFKPEPSIALDAARDSVVARRFLQTARFPKATVEKSPDGYRITLRSFPYPSDSSSGWHVQAIITTDASGKILSQRLDWDPSH